MQPLSHAGGAAERRNARSHAAHPPVAPGEVPVALSPCPCPLTAGRGSCPTWGKELSVCQAKAVKEHRVHVSRLRFYHGCQ